MDTPALDEMATFASFLGTPRGEADLASTLRRITQTAVRTLPGVDYTSITLLRGDAAFATTAATDDTILRLDEDQYALREGPCFEAITDDGVVRSQHVQTDPRWPSYGAVAGEAGIGSQLALEIYRTKSSRVGINLYSRQTDSFAYRDSTAELFATYASLAVGYAQEVDMLNHALSSRKTIGQAVGIVMERYDLTEERAFAFLVRVSQTSNIKLRTIAQEVVERAGDREEGRLSPISGTEGGHS